MLGPMEAEGRPEGGASAPAGGHEGTLRAAFAAGEASHGTLPLSFEVYAAQVLDLAGRRLARLGLPAGRESLAEVLSRTALADLHLATACEEGVEGAWETFSARYGPTLVALAIRRGARRGEAEDLARTLPGDLFSPPPTGGARTRLGTFDGSGSLAAWLGVMVGRRLADARRASGGASPQPGGVADPGADPAGRAADDETAALFAAALREAWPTLTDREAVAIRLRYGDGLPQTAIARLFGVGEPRVSRILASAEDRLRAAVGRRLGPGPAGLGDPGRLRGLLRDAVAERVATPRASADSSRGKESSDG